MNEPILSEEEIAAIYESMEGGPEGWLKTFGYQQFAEKVEQKILERLKPFGLQEQLKYRKDAERYRFLRDSPIDTSPFTLNGSVWVVQYVHAPGTIPALISTGKGQALDLSVDAARLKDCS